MHNQVPMLQCVMVAMVCVASTIAKCPASCVCLDNQVDCSNRGLTRIPTASIDSGIAILRVSINTFSNPVLVKSNFTGLNMLTELWLKGCGISSIQPGTFSDMQDLTLLDLSLNNLRVMAPDVFTGLSLNYLFLSDNPSLSLPQSGFTQMKTEVLDLKNCGLDNLSPGFFSPLVGDLRRLFVSGNNIKRVPQAIRPIFDGLETIRIHDNPLMCDCEARWLKYFYDVNKDKIRDATEGGQEPRCGGPAELAGQFFNQLLMSDFVCETPSLDAKITHTRDKGLLTCTSKGYPAPTITWLKPNGVSELFTPGSNTGPTIASLDISSSDKDINGRYKCIATNDAGNVTFEVNITWPFTTEVIPCSDSTKPETSTTKEIVIKSGSDTTATNVEHQPESDMFKVKYFTLVDLISAIFGTFVGTLIICVIILHFCVYRRKRHGSSQYSTPPLSEYSNGSMKNCVYPSSQHPTIMPLHTPTSSGNNSSMARQQQNIQNRPLPTKPYPKVYDENIYMSTGLDDSQDFIHFGQHNHGLVSASAPPCEACRTMNNPNNQLS